MNPQVETLLYIKQFLLECVEKCPELKAHADVIAFLKNEINPHIVQLRKGHPMTTEHTPEPWAYSVNVGPTKGLIVEGDGSTILELFNTLRDSRFERNLRRIVACVNACAGINTETLEHCKFEGDLQAAKQRDALAEALRELEPAALRLAQLTNLSNKEPGASVTEWNATRQAVDKARVKARAALAKLS